MPSRSVCTALVPACVFAVVESGCSRPRIAYTRGSAFAEFQEAQNGTLTRARFTPPAAQISAVKVLTSIVGGRVVHQRNP